MCCHMLAHCLSTRLLLGPVELVVALVCHLDCRLLPCSPSHGGLPIRIFRKCSLQSFLCSCAFLFFERPRQRKRLPFIKEKATGTKARPAKDKENDTKELAKESIRAKVRSVAGSKALDTAAKDGSNKATNNTKATEAPNCMRSSLCSLSLLVTFSEVPQCMGSSLCSLSLLCNLFLCIRLLCPLVRLQHFCSCRCSSLALAVLLASC